MRTVLALAFAFATLPFALPSGLDAQSRFAQPTRQNAQMRFRGMDRNNDGVITRAEWRGSAQSFLEHDWNRDGVLSGDEVRVGVPRSSRPLSDDQFDPARDRFHGWTSDNFSNLDRNRDGRVARNEWRFDAESFRRSDRNGDGVLTRAEFLGQPGVDDDRDDRFDNLDTNDDRRVERFEWHGSGEAFEWLDRNRDDVLTRDEVLGPDTTAGSGGRPVGTSGEIVRINPTQRWTDTGLDVQAGDRVTFDAEGSMELSRNGNDGSTPAGALSGRTAADAPLPRQPAGVLLARIGDSAPLVVGNRRTLQRAPVSGRLYLGVNDDHLDDNTGEYRVSVTIEHR